MEPNDISARIKLVADKIDASEHPSRALVASAIREIIAAMERSKDKEKTKNKGKKINKKDVDSNTAASMHMGLLERYKDFHDTGSNLLGFRNVVVDVIPEDFPNDVLTARKECAAAFDALDIALRNARASYSRLMASLAGIG
jgi:hypothetical protein